MDVNSSEIDDSVGLLIRKARDGSQEALGGLLERYRDHLQLMARAKLRMDLRAKCGAADLVQDTFLEAARSFEKFHGGDREQMRRWLRILLRNNLVDFVRRQRYTQRRDTSRECSLEAGEAAGKLELQDSCPPPHQQLIARERAQRLLAALEQLRPDYRQVIRLRHEDGQSWAEVAAVMGRSVGSAQKLWNRALEQLHRSLVNE
jgi:RNA polymerase sigma-70 factor (ECF subfamily)